VSGEAVLQLGCVIKQAGRRCTRTQGTARDQQVHGRDRA
jgi:hypothetical protein